MTLSQNADIIKLIKMRKKSLSPGKRNQTDRMAVLYLHILFVGVAVLIKEECQIEISLTMTSKQAFDYQCAIFYRTNDYYGVLNVVRAVCFWVND